MRDPNSPRDSGRSQAGGSGTVTYPLMRSPHLEASAVESAEDQIRFWVTRLAEPSFVYVLGPPSDPQSLKVGIAVDPVKRLRTLQTGHPHALSLYCVMPGDRWLEGELRRRAVGMGAIPTTGGTEWLWLEEESAGIIHAFLLGLAERYIDCWDGTDAMPTLPPFHQETPVEREHRWDRMREVAQYCFHIEELAEELGRDVDSVYADFVRMQQAHQPLLFRYHDVSLGRGPKRNGFATLGYRSRVS